MALQGNAAILTAFNLRGISVNALLPSAPLGRWVASTVLLAGLSLGAAMITQQDAVPSLPNILCSTANPTPAARPKSIVTLLQSKPLAGSPGKWVSTVLVKYPPLGFTARHVHGGDVTVFVLRGVVRSEHANLPPDNYKMGSTFFEPFGTTHVFIENPSATEDAEILAVIIHDKDAPLTTYLD